MHNHICFGEGKMCDEKDLVNAVLERAGQADGKRRLSCARAFELAQQFNTKIIEIGRICNQQNVRICNCQLGCFK